MKNTKQIKVKATYGDKDFIMCILQAINYMRNL